MTDYVVWDIEEVPHCFVLDQLKGVDLDVELRTGVPCSESFPPDAVFTVDPDFPNDIRLADTFDNSKRLVIASGALKDFIASWNPVAVEFLPFTILDHKSRPAGKYFIVHPVHPVDALNPTESGAKRSKRNPDWIERVKMLVLDEDKIDRTRSVFKLKGYYNCVLVRRDLADAISKQGFTGIKWTECERYESL
jgi:hypothetical protein